MSLYRTLLNDRYTQLPMAVQQLHDVQGVKRHRGECHSLRGSNIISRFIASLLGLPPSGKQLPLKVIFQQKHNREIWTRHFDKDRFVSEQWAKDGLLYERIRFITLVFQVNVSSEKLELNLKRVLFLGMNVKPLFRPKVTAIEFEKDGVFNLFIRVKLPLTGLLIEYHGWLKEDNAQD